MRRRLDGPIVGWIAACAVGALACASPGVATAASQTTTVPGSAPTTTNASTFVGLADASQTLTLQVWLAPDQTGAQTFDTAVSTPGSPTWHQFLSPAAYTARFGPTEAEAQAVSAWLTGQGMSAVATSPQRDYVTATAPVSVIDRAFAVRMSEYDVAGSAGGTQEILANDRPLAIPAALGADVISVTGLDSAPPQQDLIRQRGTLRASATAGTCASYWGEKTETLPAPFQGRTDAVLVPCGYSATQLRAADGVTAPDAGAGETIALVEDGQPLQMFRTLTQYATANGLAAPKSLQLRQEVIGEGDTCGNPFQVEEQLDSEAAYTIAPAATQLMVDGDSCNARKQGLQGLFDADAVVVDGDGMAPQATIVSNSWDLQDGEAYPPTYALTAHAIDLRAAAEGVGMYFSTGDDPGVDIPASDPYSTAVGGTTDALGAQNQTLFQTGWSNHLATDSAATAATLYSQDDVNCAKGADSWYDCGINGAAGGGTSLLWAQPSYQANVVPPSESMVNGRANRVIPDIADDADPDTGMPVYYYTEPSTGQPSHLEIATYGGTSLACPLFAATVADAQVGQSSPFGFLNPLLYTLSGSDAITDDVPLSPSLPAADGAAYIPNPQILLEVDSQTPGETSQVTAPGYDTMTGLGSPNGDAFIAALRAGS